METAHRPSIKTYLDFLQLKDNRFVMWRLTRNQELEDYWQQFIATHPELKDEFEKAIRVCDSVRFNSNQYTGQQVLYDRIKDSVAKQKRRRALHIYRMVAAAAILLLLISPLAYLGMREWNQHDEPSKELIGEIFQSKDIMLAVDGQTVTLPQSINMMIKDGYVYYGAKRVAALKGKHCCITVPAGKHTSLTLPDRSQLWINAGTTVKLPTTFNKGTRDIYVDGEIFIDAAHRPSQPFIVHTDRINVTVHGTSFDVLAYRDEVAPAVVLVRGKVMVTTPRNGSMMMQPDERVALTNGKLEKQTVDVADYVSWKDNYLSFNNTPIEKVLKQVGKYYNIRFTTADTILTGKRISGKLYLSNQIDDVLNSISLMTATTYKRDKNIVKFIEKERR